MKISVLDVSGGKFPSLIRNFTFGLNNSKQFHGKESMDDEFRKIKMEKGNIEKLSFQIIIDLLFQELIRVIEN